MILNYFNTNPVEFYQSSLASNRNNTLGSVYCGTNTTETQHVSTNIILLLGLTFLTFARLTQDQINL